MLLVLRHPWFLHATLACDNHLSPDIATCPTGGHLGSRGEALVTEAKCLKEEGWHLRGTMAQGVGCMGGVGVALVTSTWSFSRQTPHSDLLSVERLDFCVFGGSVCAPHQAHLPPVCDPEPPGTALCLTAPKGGLGGHWGLLAREPLCCRTGQHRGCVLMATVCWDTVVGRPDTGFLTGGGECGIVRHWTSV